MEPTKGGMEVLLRCEKQEDYPHVFKIVEEAFQHGIHSDHDEQFLVEKLRKSDAFIPELSIVAEYKGAIVGHILLTRISIDNGKELAASLALAPVSVKPEFQNRGIGGNLILESHRVAKNLGYRSVVLLGHKDYYPRFGYRLAKQFGIKLPFEAPEECCMVVELIHGALTVVNGMVVYPKEFY